MHKSLTGRHKGPRLGARWGANQSHHRSSAKRAFSLQVRKPEWQLRDQTCLVFKTVADCGNSQFPGPPPSDCIRSVRVVMGTAKSNGAEFVAGFAPAGGAYTPGKGSHSNQNTHNPAAPVYPAPYGAAGQPSAGYGQAPPGYAQQPGYSQQYSETSPGYGQQQPMPFQVHQAPPPLACGLGVEFVWYAPPRPPPLFPAPPYLRLVRGHVSFPTDGDTPQAFSRSSEYLRYIAAISRCLMYLHFLGSLTPSASGDLSSLQTARSCSICTPLRQCYSDLLYVN